MSEPSTNWYIVQTSAGSCQIVTADQLPAPNAQPGQQWGPFSSESEALARRVGLIRAGKCKPV